MDLKMCSSCRETYQIQLFNVIDRKTKEKSDVCKVCMKKEKNRKYYESNKENYKKYYKYVKKESVKTE